MSTNSKQSAASMGPGMSGPELFGRAQAADGYDDLDDPVRQIPDDEAIDVGDLLQDSRIDEVLEQLDNELVALDEVKRRVRDVAALLLVDRMRRHIGIEAPRPTLHMSFTGNPGTGKTTVAKRMGQILYQLGYVRKGHVVSVTRDDLVGKYVGHTAPKTREVLNRATGGVLFIDEAYHIYRVDNERDYGQETVELLLQYMEQDRDDLVVIMAGYKDRMERFFSDVPGLSSRIGHHIDFPDYDLDELMSIGDLLTSEQGYRLTPEARDMFREYLTQRQQQPRFANGRSVRNALDRMRLRHASRIWNELGEREQITKAELTTLTGEDIASSRVLLEPSTGN